MSRPAVGTATETLYDALAPLAPDDEASDWPLLKLCSAICDPLLQPVDDVVRDDEDGTYAGWERVLDPDVAPEDYLVWLGQFVGVTVTPRGTDELAEDFILRAVTQIKDEAGFRRGRPATIAAAARTTLTGTQTVYFIERPGNDAYKLTVATRDSETPDPVLTEKSVRAAKPAGIVLTYDTIVGGDYQTLRDTHTDYTDVRSQFATYSDVRNDPSLT